jgi:uncharacterized protein YbcI
VSSGATHDEPADRPVAGDLNAALARAVVRIHRSYAGRGPTKAQAFFRHNVLVVLLEDVMTTVERSLVASGQHATVLGVRQQLHEAMRADLEAAVEGLTGRRVTAFLSDLHLDPDLAAEVFVLDGPVRGA